MRTSALHVDLMMFKLQSQILLEETSGSLSFRTRLRGHDRLDYWMVSQFQVLEDVVVCSSLVDCLRVRSWLLRSALGVCPAETISSFVLDCICSLSQQHEVVWSLQLEVVWSLQI